MKPGGHALQEGDPAVEYVSGAQELQTEKPVSALEKVFGPQSSQSSDESCLVMSSPSSGSKVPGRQEMHDVCREAEVAWSGLYVPEGHI